MQDKLTPYAKAHTTLSAIDSRWESLKRKRAWDSILVFFAEVAAKTTIDNIGHYLDDFDAALKPAKMRRMTTTERKDMDVTVAITMLHGFEVGLNQYNELIINQRNGTQCINLGLYSRNQIKDLSEYLLRLGIHLE